MSRISAFFNQPNRRYLAFQLVFGFLTIQFAIPAVSYVVAPEVAIGQLSQIGELLGSGSYLVPEAQSHVWRHLGAANVMTLALMCGLMQLNLRKWIVVLPVLMFLKGYNASLFLGDFLFGSAYAAFGVVAFWDFLNCWMFWFFARRAHAEILDRPDEELVPRPWGLA